MVRYIRLMAWDQRRDDRSARSAGREPAPANFHSDGDARPTIEFKAWFRVYDRWYTFEVSNGGRVAGVFVFGDVFLQG